MPINRILKHEAFHPEHISVMGHVFEDVLRTLGQVDRQNPFAERVAKKVIELAQAGDCDPPVEGTYSQGFRQKPYQDLALALAAIEIVSGLNATRAKLAQNAVCLAPIGHHCQRPAASGRPKVLST